MKTRDFEEWKQDFMKNSDPITGDTVGIRFDDVTSDLIPQVRQKLKGIPQDCVDYAIQYCSPPFVEASQHRNVMIVFDRLSEFDDACRMCRCMMQKDTPDHFVNIFVGGHRLFVQIKITGQTKDVLMTLQSSAALPENFDGIRLQGEG